MKGRMAKTIKEIAAECGVSEQAVRGWCRRNHVAKDAKGSFALSESQKSSIYLHYLGVERNEVSQPAKASCETCETSETVLISMLQKELDRKETQLSVKDKQLAVKDEQIRELNARLAECRRRKNRIGIGLDDCSKNKYKKESVRNKYDYFGDNLYVSCWCYRSFFRASFFLGFITDCCYGRFYFVRN